MPGEDESRTDGGSVGQRLIESQRQLLDLSARNRLLNTRRSSTRSSRLEILDELSEEVYRHLVHESKSMTFLPRAEGVEDDHADESDAEEAVHLLQPEEDEVSETGLAARYIDNRLQTSLPSQTLQSRLLKLYYDARNFEEEQGVNILYLVLGFLKWYESDDSHEERYAPLILVPVSLSRSSAQGRFRIGWTEDDISTNLSLQEKLASEFSVELPEISDSEEFSPTEYFSSVAKSIASLPRWSVLENDIVLWFFSFSKFLMYRDLDPSNWPSDNDIGENSLISALLKDGFHGEPPLVDEGENVDKILSPSDMVHILDADSSQTIAIEEVRRGRNLVIQGPPGTGKSQTIANLIAAAVADGKKVLFVAEKMAALEVVKRRLDNLDVGDICLELHSHKANKKRVLNDLEGTLDLSRPKVEEDTTHAENLTATRDILNRHAEVMHTPIEPASVTPYAILGRLVSLKAEGVPPADFRLEAAPSWTPGEFREKRNLLDDLKRHMEHVGNPSRHPWRGVSLKVSMPTEHERMERSLPEYIECLGAAIATTERLAGSMGVESPDTYIGAARLIALAQRMIGAPKVDRNSIGSRAWSESRNHIDALIANGQALAACRQKLNRLTADIAWSTDVTQTRRDMAAYGRSMFRILNGNYRKAKAVLRGILVDKPPRSLEMRIAVLDGLIAGQKALRHIENDENTGHIGKQAFGSMWLGAESDWDALGAIAEWEEEGRRANMPSNFRQILASFDSVEMLTKLVESVETPLRLSMSQIRELLESLEFDLEMGFGVNEMQELSLSGLRERLGHWANDIESITYWISYFARWRVVESEGMGGLASRLDRNLVTSEDVIQLFDRAYYDGTDRSRDSAGAPLNRYFVWT